MAKSPGQVKAGAAFIEVTLSNDQFQKDWAKLRANIGRLTGPLARAGAAATAFGVAIGVALGRMALVAADAETGFRRFALIFSDDADMMRRKLEALSSSTGIAMTTLIRQSSSFGAVFSELGQQLGPDQFTDIVTKAQKAVIDLSGIAGISMDEAADRIKSALTSTGESVDQYGFNLRQAEINQELMRMGINKNVRQLTELEKQLVKIQIIQKSIERGQLDFTNMTGTLNAKIAQLRSNLEELWVVLSRFLMPVLKAAVMIFNAVVRILASFPINILTSTFGLVAGIIAVIAFSVGTLSLAIAGLASVFTLAAGQLTAFNAALATFGGMSGIINGMTLTLAASWVKLTAAIASATVALRAFLVTMGPLLLAGAVIGAAAYGAAEALKPNEGVGDWWIPNKTLAAYEKRVREFDAAQNKQATRPAAMGTSSVMGSRLLAQQLQYGTGVSTPAQESAKHLSHLSQIADQVLGDGGDSIRTTQES